MIKLLTALLFLISGTFAISEDDCVDQSIHPVPEDCHNYFQCIQDGNGGWIIKVFSCGDELVFHPELLVCTYPDQAPDGICDGTYTKPPEPTTPSPPTTLTPPIPTTTTTGKPLPPGQTLVCYFEAWSIYRPLGGKFEISDIDASLCTHLTYGFAKLQEHTWEAVPYDPWFDLCPGDNGGLCGFRKFNDLKKTHPGLKTVLAIGGWNEGSRKYSQMASDKNRRKKFVDSAVALAIKHGFDGIDMDWEYPGVREGADPVNDKHNFVLLLKELKEQLEPKGMILTAALSPGEPNIKIAYDIPGISKYLDVMSVMCYDYHGWWEDHGFTGHNAPLFPIPEENCTGHPGWHFTVEATMKIWIDGGAPREKLVVGMPLYGRGFKLAKAEDNGLYCPAVDAIPKGPYTQEKGYWSFMEVMEAQNADSLPNLPGATPHEWKVTMDNCILAPYASNGPYWISYDNVDSIGIKTKYVNSLGVGGAMVWAVDTDDFKGKFHPNKYPLLQTIHDTLVSGEVIDPDMVDPQHCSAPVCSSDMTCP